MVARAVTSLIKYFLISMIILLLFSVLSSKTVEAKTNDFFFDNLILAANLNLKSGNAEDALEKFIKAEKQAPDNADVLIGLVRSYSKLGDFNLARKKLSRMEKHHQYDMRIHLVKGEYFAMKGHIEEAAGEFTLLVKKGIYRFEALQGLIRLYAETSDNIIKSVIDITIPLYEKQNQVALYKVMVKCLEESGRFDEAQTTARLLRALDSESVSTGSNDNESEMSELEITICQIERLLSEKQFKDAEILLTDATHKWPTNAKIQELLKTCYWRMIDNVPVNPDTEQNQAIFNRMVSKSEGTSVSLDSMIPPDISFSLETEVYVTDILRITGETEKYFLKMITNFSNLQSRVGEDSYQSNTEQNKAEAQNLKELELLLNESSKVLKMEIDALNETKPPKNFIQFHNYLISTTMQLHDAFKQIKKFITNKDWTSYFKVMGLLTVVDMQMDELAELFDQAIIMEMRQGARGYAANPQD